MIINQSIHEVRKLTISPPHVLSNAGYVTTMFVYTSDSDHAYTLTLYSNRPIESSIAQNDSITDRQIIREIQGE